MRKSWSEEEVKFLLENYNSMPLKEIAKRLGRTLHSIRSKARQLSVKKRSMVFGCKRWSQDEDEILVKYYSVLPREELQKLLPNRSWAAIQTRAERLLKCGRAPLINTISKEPSLSLTEPQKAYIAGLLDGEGTITLVKHGSKIYPEVSITNTKKEVIEWLRSVTQVGVITIENKSRSKRNWNTCYKFRVLSLPEASAILKAVLPYLIIKKKQAELVLKFIEELKTHIATEKRRNYSLSQNLLDIYDEVRRLNDKRRKTTKNTGRGQVSAHRPRSPQEAQEASTNV